MLHVHLGLKAQTVIWLFWDKVCLFLVKTCWQLC